MPQQNQGHRNTLLAGLALIAIAVLLFFAIRQNVIADFLGIESASGFSGSAFDMANAAFDLVIKLINLVCAIVGTYFTYIGVKRSAQKP